MNVAEITAELATGAVFGYQCVGDPATLMIGVPRDRTRPAMWMSSSGTTVMLAQFHSMQMAALAVVFLNRHNEAVQHVINTHEKKNG